MSLPSFKKVQRVDHLGNTIVEHQFFPTLVGINTTSPQTYVNGAGETKTYYLASIDFVAPNGVEQKGVTTQIHAASFDKGIKIGESYLSTLTKDTDGKLWVRTSHLLKINALDTAAFEGLDFDAIMETTEAKAAVPTA